MDWRVISSGKMDAATNMAIDEAILLAHAAGDVPPTLRFYGWQPQAVSLGFFQKAAMGIDIDECRSRGVDIVRRLTGGRAVLHAEELTYSIVVREDYPAMPSTITASYRYLSGGLLAGLKQLGLDARMNLPQSAYGQSKKVASTAACFDAPSHYEITVDGRKLVGSAQLRRDGVILQHGSILLGFSAQDTAAILHTASPQIKEQLAEMLARKVISIDEALNRKVSWQEVAECLHQSFGPALGAEFVRGELTERELANSHELVTVKYSQDCWNRLR